MTFASVGSRTPHGARVGPVYTPPDRRRPRLCLGLRRGREPGRLDSGLRFLFLFTDLANPTSNHIYEAIGYEPVRDVDIWRFETGRRDAEPETIRAMDDAIDDIEPHARSPA